MDTAIDWIRALPQWAYVAGVAAGVVLIAMVVVLVVRRAAFRRRLVRLTQPAQDIPARRLLARSSTVEAVARGQNPAVVALTGIDELWVAALRRRPNEKNFSRVLQYAPEKGLFACFDAALRDADLAKRLHAYFAEGKDFLIFRRIALSGPGQPFDGVAAREFFSDQLDEIREMTGDPEWAARYFALTILLEEPGEKSQRAVWELRDDPRALIRATVISRWDPGERKDEFFAAAQSALLNDPVIEVRRAARDRLLEDFPERYHFDLGSLTSVQSAHLLELLSPERAEDHNLALEALSGKDLERSLPAALFLEETGVLQRLIRDVRFSDKKELDRTVKLLANAASVGVTDFLKSISASSDDATLYAAATVLRKSGPPTLIATIAEHTFDEMAATPESEELLAATLQAIRDRGTEPALRKLAEALQRYRADSHIGQILDSVPPRSPLVLVPVLISLMESEDFAAHKALREALARFQVEYVLPSLMRILSAPRERYPHQTRITALRTLGEFRKPYLLDFVLERMSILPVDEALEFAEVLAEYSGDEFDARVAELLEGSDASVRSALIAALPATGHKDFLKQIRQAVDDADPEVRIASVWALVGFQDSRALTQAQSRLRDPIERVRVETARALGAAGTATAVKALASVFEDENEVDVVKRAAITGLGESSSTAAIDVLVDALEGNAPFPDEIVTSLSKNRSAVALEHLIERMKDAGPPAKQHIAKALTDMGEEAEEMVVELLKRDIASLRDYIVEVLDEIGFVESTIRKLSHRGPERRREAARVLSQIGTLSAFRGIVLAARDPDDQVRVEVTKALEGLSTPGGQEILDQLRKDPEKRVRKYTQWALQRIESKSK